MLYVAGLDWQYRLPIPTDLELFARGSAGENSEY